MAFPSSFNFSYYQGDRYEFTMRPKDSAGNIFPLQNYLGSGLFTVATQRGTPSSVVGYGTVNMDANEGKVTCIIEPDFGKTLTGNSYIYDVQISASALTAASAVYTPYVYTLVTGNISVTRDISNTYGGS